MGRWKLLSAFNLSSLEALSPVLLPMLDPRRGLFRDNPESRSAAEGRLQGKSVTAYEESRGPDATPVQVMPKSPGDFQYPKGLHIIRAA